MGKSKKPTRGMQKRAREEAKVAEPWNKHVDNMKPVHRGLAKVIDEKAKTKEKMKGVLETLHEKSKAKEHAVKMKGVHRDLLKVVDEKAKTKTKEKMKGVHGELKAKENAKKMKGVHGELKAKENAKKMKGVHRQLRQVVRDSAFYRENVTEPRMKKAKEHAVKMKDVHRELPKVKVVDEKAKIREALKVNILKKIDKVEQVLHMLTDTVPELKDYAKACRKELMQLRIDIKEGRHLLHTHLGKLMDLSAKEINKTQKHEKSRAGKVVSYLHHLFSSLGNWLSSLFHKRPVQHVHRLSTHDVVKTQLRGFNDALEAIHGEIHDLIHENESVHSNRH